MVQGRTDPVVDDSNGDDPHNLKDSGIDLLNSSLSSSMLHVPASIHGDPDSSTASECGEINR